MSRDKQGKYICDTRMTVRIFVGLSLFMCEMNTHGSNFHFSSLFDLLHMLHITHIVSMLQL
jgi:hypothetical protein